MKTKIKKLGLAAVLLAAAICLELNAQPTECTGWECTGDWNYSEFGSGVCGDTNDCGFIVHYRWRECIIDDDTIRELEITSIELISGGNCENATNSEIVNKAIQSLLADAHAIFSEPISKIEINLRIPSCLRRKEENNKLYLNNDGCNAGCCLANYQVQYTGSATKVLAQNLPSPPGSCGGGVGYTCSSNCNNMNMPIGWPLIPFYADGTWFCSNGCGTASWNTQQANFSDASMSLVIWWAYRGLCTESQPYHHQIQIIRIDVVKPYGQWPRYEYIQFSMSKAIHDLIHKLSLEDEWIKVLIHQCWTDVNGGIEPCHPPYLCCYRLIWVNVTLPNHAHIKGEYDPVYYGSQYENECTYMCEWECDAVQEFHSGFGPLPKKSEFIELDEGNSNIFLNGSNELTIIPNPVDDLVDIIFKSNLTGSFKISIYDAEGNNVYQAETHAKSEELNWKIQTKHFASGIYNVNILVDGLQAVNGRFAVIH